MLIILDVHIGRVNHLLHGRGTIAEQRGMEDEVGVFRIELAQHSEGAVTVEGLLLTADAVGSSSIILAFGKIAVIAVGTALIVGEAELEERPSTEDTQSYQCKQV